MLFAHDVVSLTVVGFIQLVSQLVRGGMTQGDTQRMWEGTTHCISSLHIQEGQSSLY